MTLDAQDWSRMQGEVNAEYNRRFNENRERVYEDLASRTGERDELLQPPPRLSPLRPRLLEPEPEPPRRALVDLDVSNKWLALCTPARRAARVNAPRKYDVMTFETYPYDPSSVLAWLAALKAGGRRGLVLSGPVGNGKTSLGVCALRALAAEGLCAGGDRENWNLACEADRFDPLVTLAADEPEDGRAPSTPWPAPCWFAFWPDLMAAYTENQRRSETKWTEKLQDVAALMLDEVGVRGQTDYREEFLRRHFEWLVADGRRVLILTTNAMPEEWDARLGERCADRLREDFEVIVMRGDSLRGQQRPAGDDLLG